MNKLISKNPVLRFKEGKKIIKAKWGDAAPYPIDFRDPEGNPYAGMWYNENGKPVGTALIYNNELVRLIDSETPFYENWYLRSTPYYKISAKNKYIGPLDFKNSYSQTGGHPTIDKKTLPKGNSSKTNNIFIKGFQNRKGEIKDVRAMLKKLMELGLLKDRFGADGKWGKNTEAAYLKYLSIKNIPEYTPFEHISPAELMGIPTNEENTPLYQRIRFKQGGLISKNPVERFKLGKKIVKALQGKTLPTAPKAEDRYKNSRRDSVAYWTLTPDELGRSIKRVTTPNNAKIQREIIFNRGTQNNDTIYTEVPEHDKWKLFPIKTNIKPRKGFSFAQTPEYEILKRRFNTAWSLSK